MNTFNYNMNQNTTTVQLKGIYSRNEGESWTMTKTLCAIDHNDQIVAKITYSVVGNRYISAHKKFGDQLQTAIGDRCGY